MIIIGLTCKLSNKFSINLFINIFFIFIIIFIIVYIILLFIITIIILLNYFLFLFIYFTEEKARLNLSEFQICVVILDLWRVHICQDFLSWVKQKYKYIKFVFIPPGCTGIIFVFLFMYLYITFFLGKAQVCDLVVNKPIKEVIRDGLSVYILLIYLFVYIIYIYFLIMYKYCKYCSSSVSWSYSFFCCS